MALVAGCNRKQCRSLPGRRTKGHPALDSRCGNSLTLCRSRLGGTQQTKRLRPPAGPTGTRRPLHSCTSHAQRGASARDNPQPADAPASLSRFLLGEAAGWRRARRAEPKTGPGRPPEARSGPPAPSGQGEVYPPRQNPPQIGSQRAGHGRSANPFGWFPPQVARAMATMTTSTAEAGKDARTAKTARASDPAGQKVTGFAFAGSDPCRCHRRHTAGGHRCRAPVPGPTWASPAAAPGPAHAHLRPGLLAHLRPGRCLSRGPRIHSQRSPVQERHILACLK